MVLVLVLVLVHSEAVVVEHLLTKFLSFTLKYEESGKGEGFERHSRQDEFTAGSNSYTIRTVKPMIPARIRCRIFKHINKLPVELLVEIFLWCNPIGTFPLPSRDRAPILLGRVCRLWRSVSLNTPQLWAHTTIEDIRPHNLPIIRNAPVLDEWLRRSGNCPLSITVNKHRRDLDCNALSLKLQAEVHRWKSERHQ
ncbi:hypothetical protein BD410DRAFT_828895 [Rickenella mellea]|uniref:F-box domain-containing protein n=1 Tax=Rickenella mellea TaxID=50990 RepID=A0A4Y7Q3C2_9AGAM|nr:hypothetical protein BD410DRAFT_828895 [Rickenella mellea]